MSAGFDGETVGSTCPSLSAYGSCQTAIASCDDLPPGCAYYARTKRLVFNPQRTSNAWVAGSTDLFPVCTLEAAPAFVPVLSVTLATNDAELCARPKGGSAITYTGVGCGCPFGTVTETGQGHASVGQCCPGDAHRSQGSCQNDHKVMNGVSGYVCWTGGNWEDSWGYCATNNAAVTHEILWNSVTTYNPQPPLTSAECTFRAEDQPSAFVKKYFGTCGRPPNPGMKRLYTDHTIASTACQLQDTPPQGTCWKAMVWIREYGLAYSRMRAPTPACACACACVHACMLSCTPLPKHTCQHACPRHALVCLLTLARKRLCVHVHAHKCAQTLPRMPASASPSCCVQGCPKSFHIHVPSYVHACSCAGLAGPYRRTIWP